MEREPCGERAHDRAAQRTLAFVYSLRACFDQGGAAKRRAKGKDGFKNPLGKEKKEKQPEARGADRITEQLREDRITEQRQLVP
jgi:hypothetical protein